MDPVIRAQVNGVDELVRKLRKPLNDSLRTASLAIATEIQDRMSPYAPMSQANSPSNPTGRWYERGYGLRWKTRKGVGGRETSETMNRRWAIQPTNNGATLKNLASYSAYVYHDPEDTGSPHQAWFHKARGWKNDADVIKSVVSDGTVQTVVTKAIIKELEIEG